MKYAYFLMAVSISMLAACSRVNEIDIEEKITLDEGELVERVIFEAPAIRFLGEDDETRASLSQEGEGSILFAWEATDTVGIYPNHGSQVIFEMTNGVGTNVANFDGGGWALRGGSTYSCYFPFVGDIYLDRNSIPISFAHQVQTGVSNYEGVNFYLASEGTSSSSGVLRFSFQMLNTVIRIKAIGLPAGTYSKLSLTTDEPLFVQDGTFGLEDMTIMGKTYSNTLEIALKEFSLSEPSTEANPVLIYLTSAPVDLRGHTVTIRAFSKNGSIYKCEKNPRKAFEAQAWGGLKCEMEKESQTNPVPEIVDLGLSVKWASFNLGASAPEEYGDYYAWGEISPRSDVPEGAYAWAIYKLCNGEYAHMLKYNTNSSYGEVDGLTILEKEDDAAATNLHGFWRMPTAEEQDELLKSCTWNWTYRGNTYGYEIVSNVNGNSIFLPAAGYKGDFSDVSEVSETGLYWSSSLTNGSQMYTAQRLRFTDSEMDLIDINRSFALQIRPVWDINSSPYDNVQFADLTFKTFCIENFDTNGDGELSCAEAEAVTVIDVTSKGIISLQGIECFSNLIDLSCGENQLTSLDLSNNTALTKLNCRYNQLTNLDVSNNSALIDLDCSYNLLTNLVLNNAALTWLSCQFNQLTNLDLTTNTALTYLYCRNNQLTSLDVSNNSALANLICSPMNDNHGNNLLGTLYLSYGQSIPNVTIDRSVLNIPAETQIIVKPEAVDLGLPSGLKWASLNLGASAPEEYGDYYAWGDPEPYYSSQVPLTWKEGKESGYNLASYKWCKGSYNTITKYCILSSFGYEGFTDGKTIIDSEDDAAHVKLGGKWRMPTNDEWEELISNCSTTWTTENGVEGRRFTSNKTGNSIFFPAAGYRFSLSLGNEGHNFYYWTSTLSEGDSGNSWLFCSEPDQFDMWTYGRDTGFSIRPVSD